MACCGDRRVQQRAHAGSGPSRPALRGGAAASAPVVFEFNGRRAIVVTGPLTGVTYRFARPGTRLAVHRADAPSLMSVPGLGPAPRTSATAGSKPPRSENV